MWIAVTVMLAAGATSGCASRTEFFVSHAGRDGHDGSRDRPFRTLARAQAAARDAGKATIWLAGGTYRLAKPLRLSARDSNTAYRALPGEEVVVSGGVALRPKWAPHRDGIYKAQVGRRSFRQLYVNGRRAVRARTGCFDIQAYERVTPGAPRGTGSGPALTGRVIVPARQVADLGDLRGVEMHLKRKFAQHILRIEAVERNVRGPDARGVKCVAIRFRRPEADVIRAFRRRAVLDSYFLANSLRFLDAEDEWFLDERTGVLFYKPRAGEDVHALDFVAPVAAQLVVMDGAENVTFEGIRFEHTSWTQPSRRGSLGQQAGFYETATRYWYGAFQPPAGVAVRRSRRVRLTGCTFTHFGGAGVGIGRGSRDVILSRCTITDISGSGVNVDDHSARRMKHVSQPSVSEIAIRECTITHCGREFFGSVGVWVGYARNVVIERSELAHLPYSAVSLGWRTIRPGVQGGMRVEGNHIHHYMTELADGGAIYSLGHHRPPGSVILRNYIHDVGPEDDSHHAKAARAGIYLDDGTRGFLVTENVIVLGRRGFLAPALWGWRRYRTENLLVDNYLTESGHEEIVDAAGPVPKAPLAKP